MACMSALVLATPRRLQPSGHSEGAQGNGRGVEVADGQETQSRAALESSVEAGEGGVEGPSLAFFLLAAQEQPRVPGVLAAVSHYLAAAFPLVSQGRADSVPVGERELL